jgi:1,4-dihydroxy-2-naphthoate octaprenyltransferase
MANAWVEGARPRTLPAAIVPVAVGTACVVGVGDIVWWRAAAALVVALSLQVATNYANDYSDGVRGTDSNERRVGPVRLVGSGLKSPSSVKKAALAAFGVAGVAGLALAVAVGPELLVVGVASIAAGWFYTGGPRPYGYAGLGELFVFVFFGVVATVGSTYVHLERTTWLSFGCSVAVGLLATALLVVNNLRDIPGDTESGKRTLAVRLGAGRTRVLYTVLMTLPFVALIPIGGFARPGVALGFAAILIGRKAVITVLSGARGAELIGVLAQTGQTQLVYGALLTIGVIISAPS